MLHTGWNWSPGGGTFLLRITGLVIVYEATESISAIERPIPIPKHLMEEENSNLSLNDYLPTADSFRYGVKHRGKIFWELFLDSLSDFHSANLLAFTGFE